MFDVYRYAERDLSGAVTSALPRDPQKVQAALASPNCVGVVENVAARNAWAAMDAARSKFDRLECTLGPRGREFADWRKKGAAA